MYRIGVGTDLCREGYRVVNTSVSPNLVAPDHCHDFGVKVFVLGGDITITRDNDPVAFRAGQCFAVPPRHAIPWPSSPPLANARTSRA